MVSSWLGSWTPEHIVGLLTALGVIITAVVFKGRYRSATTASSDKDMMSSVRLHPLDLMLLENVAATMHTIQTDVRDIEVKVNTILTDTAVIRDRQRNT